ALWALLPSSASSGLLRSGPAASSSLVPHYSLLASRWSSSQYCSRVATMTAMVPRATLLRSTAALLLSAASGFVPPARPAAPRGAFRDTLTAAASCAGDDARVVIVGKVILDRYGDPSCRDDEAEVTIGGGGPQATWGACAALAVRDMIATSEEGTWEREPASAETRGVAPPKQRVTFLAPIGTKNWSPERTEALASLLPMLESPPALATSSEHITPTIDIWHDEDEIVNWKPVDGSFGLEGADGLWRNRPSAGDILDAIGDHKGNIVLHAILESGADGAGGGLDASPFFDASLVDRVSVAGVEPIVFPEEETGLVTDENAKCVSSLIRRVEASLSSSCMTSGNEKLLVVSPDRPCYEALFRSKKEARHDMNACDVEYAVRDGASGSLVHDLLVPSASLDTLDGVPVNPTGAGNAYAGAYVACRGTGSSAAEAAILANAVGAAVCEHENLPPWTWEVLERMTRGACEVQGKVRKMRSIAHI
ncbi:hypothetical protein ACHAWF_014072, partial [Thalassiosira exigua]